MKTRAWIWTLFFVLALGCAEEKAAPEHASSWSTVKAAFDTDFFDETQRTRWFTGAAASQLVLPALITPERYQYLGLSELRWMGTDRRQGEVAFSIDGWPASLMIQMTRVQGRWQFVQVSASAQQERLRLRYTIDYQHGQERDPMVELVIRQKS